jgi:hypothetical protein
VERRIVRHSSRLSAALDPQFSPGQRVQTLQGQTGRILLRDEAFSPGASDYIVLPAAARAPTWPASCVPFPRASAAAVRRLRTSRPGSPPGT